MIEGMRLVFHRFLYAMFAVIGLMPVYHIIRTYVDGEIVANAWTWCIGGLAYIDMGIGMMPFIFMIGIAVSVFHLYYRSIQKRKYESQYTQESFFNEGYNRR